MRSTSLNKKPYTIYPVRGAALRRWVRRGLVALLFLVTLVLVAAGGVYLWLDLQVREANQGPGDKAAVSAIQETLTTVPGGGEPSLDKPDAQDILVLGSDSRGGADGEYGRSDTLMLVHVDPEEDYISILSLPRDLRVEVPGRGMQKINAAFAYGGPALAIQTVQRLTNLDLDHYINIDFEAFRSITTALGGIYVDVDRRYYYGGNSYENIDIQPGYQRLAGEQALDFVRFRHDGNVDFGRMARQQRFLQAARDQVSKWDAAFKIPQLVQLIAQNTSTDISTAQALKLAIWGVRLDGARIKQVTLEVGGAEIGGASYVTATDAAIRDAVRDLMMAPESSGPVQTGTSSSTAVSSGTTTTTAAPNRVDLTGITVNVFNGNGRSGEAKAAGSWLESMGAVIGRVGDAASHDNARSSVLYPPASADAARLVGQALGVTRVREDVGGETISVVLGADFVLPEGFRPQPTLASIPDSDRWRTIVQKAEFAVMAPEALPDGYSFKNSRLYDLDTDEGSFPALKVYYKLRGEDQYLGLMETTFLDAPAAAVGQEVTMSGTVFTVVALDDHVDRIWWKKDGVLYWLSNTLDYRLDRDAMLGLADSMFSVR